MKKWILIFGVISIFLIVSALTNPTTEDFLAFDQVHTGVAMPDNLQIAEADFVFFSIYAPAPENTVNEYGTVSLGFMGHFFKVSEGQYDESVWKRFLE